MNHKSSSERMAEAMKRARQHWQAQPRAALTASPPSPIPPAFTIAISRDAGANGSQIAAEVGERLGWPVYDKALLEHIASEMGVHASLLESVDEKRQGWWQECLDAFSSSPSVTQGGYSRRLVQALFSLAAHGGCIIVGRGAAQALPAQTTLRVRLVGTVTERVEVIRKRLGLSRPEAETCVELTDRERAHFVKSHFHKDPSDPCGYDLVLSSPRFSVAQCAETIIQALHHLQANAAALQKGVLVSP